MKRLVFIFGLAAVVAHALVSALAGSLNPTDWSLLERLACIMIVAPCVGLAIAILEGTFESPPSLYSQRGSSRRRGR